MKFILPALFLGGLFLSCHNSPSPKITGDGTDTAVYLPYVPFYSSKLGPGKTIFLKKVLDIWKEYESGNVLKQAGNFADTVRLIFTDSILRAPKQQALAFYKKRRDSLSDIQLLLNSCLSTHAADANEDLVFIWGMQDGTKNGHRIYFVFHEIWRFNKRGKIYEMAQYLTHPY